MVSDIRMNTETLVRMANQIGCFFEFMPNRSQALNDIVLHIKKYWEPRMRAQLRQHLAADQGSGLSDIVLKACSQHPDLLK